LPTDPNVLVGFNTNDDAGVYLLGDGLALVQTVDFSRRSSTILLLSDKLPRPTL
jgi:selenophosphate synthase